MYKMVVSKHVEPGNGFNSMTETTQYNLCSLSLEVVLAGKGVVYT